MAMTTALQPALASAVMMEKDGDDDDDAAAARFAHKQACEHGQSVVGVLLP